LFYLQFISRELPGGVLHRFVMTLSFYGQRRPMFSAESVKRAVLFLYCSSLQVRCLAHRRVQ